ncbi:hypothetical protein DM01DRAFT_1324300 [Hesseltinella vesiculosa]|uniref:Coenzyme Q-binding protein COQ10 START domain-containing protein n=1 Tax=Hesseltinella vesiculosa TaxID=101127 RepID=A0A1X2GDA0_9FUNG|nr:hypothetical protein DM01DRAFT_1324300 [Hesseltinella vesiculosa]
MLHLRRPVNHTSGQTRCFFSLGNALRNASIKKYNEQKVLNFTPQQVYNVVANVDEYHRFLPFCTHSKVYSSKPMNQYKVMQAELGIGFNLFKEKYISTVTCQPTEMVKAVSMDATLFKELVTIWRFKPKAQGQQCEVDFHISFEFASPLHAQASNVFFDQVSKMMMKAFIDQCHHVYH